jgi:hypothetical protein
MQLGEHLFKANDKWWPKFEPADVKNRRWIEVSLPQTLTPWLDRYISEIRPAVLARRGKGSKKRPHLG